MGYCVVFDIGTTAVKAMVLDKQFAVAGSVTAEYDLLSPAKGCLEVEPEVYWKSIRQCMEELKKALGGRLKQVDYVTVTGQGETLIPVDTEGRPLRNAIVWLDTRAEEESHFLAEWAGRDRFYQTTGIPECTSAVPVCKLLWFRKNEPQLYKKTARFLLVGDYIIFRLTGRLCTEKTLMSTTGYFDVRSDCLWNDILACAGIDAEQIPEQLESGVRVGEILEQTAQELGFPVHTPVYTSAMDQVACAVGSGNIEEGIVTGNVGTCMILAMTASAGVFKKGSNLSVYRHTLAGKYLAMTNCPTAGIVLKWFKDEFCQREAVEAAERNLSVYDCLGALAGDIPPGCGGLIMLPHFSGVMQPESIPNARGVFFGITLETKKPHMIRCIMESIGYMLRENLEYLEAAGGFDVTEIRSLGGASKSAVWEKIKADISGRNLLHMREGECTALGAAVIASVGAGWYDSEEQAYAAGNSVTEVIKYSGAHRDAYENGYQTYLNLHKHLKPLFEKG